VLIDAAFEIEAREAAKALVEAVTEQRRKPDKADGKPPAPLVSTNLWHMLKSPAPLRSWHIQDWMPGDDVTGLFGDGGEGKTQLCMQLAYCTATGMPWLGLDVRPGPVLYFSAEEPNGELHFRGAQIAAGIVVPPEAHRHPVEMISRAREDALLCTFTKEGRIQPTPLFNELERMAGEMEPALIILDAAADIYGGEENDRAQVRAFISMLRRLALDLGCAILLVGHPSRDGMRSGLGYSGSTAWHNSMRARWYFTTPKGEGGEELDQSLRQLSLEKSNRGRRGQKITGRWNDGWFGIEYADEGRIGPVMGPPGLRPSRQNERLATL
jgi:RecA-family ATPase